MSGVKIFFKMLLLHKQFANGLAHAINKSPFSICASLKLGLI